MLQIPRVPSESSGFHFDAEAVQAHQTRQALAEEIRETIEALVTSTYIPGWQGMFHKFRDCIEPGAVRNLSRLPYQASGSNDTSGTKIGCVYARLSWAIQLYWDQCLDSRDNTALIREYLCDLGQIAAAGIDKGKMLGNLRTGYWLSVK
jgi:hypothetical protein